jgi:hypothetical protein
MADAKLSAAPLPAHASPHPMANPGYGKRAAPDQLPRTDRDFAHLPPREAAIAAYIDRLPDGADISVKTLAKTLPYGQCALRTALNNLTRAGHLRRGREHLADSASPRWITRTWFSRTARDDDWWAAFTRGDVPQEPPEPRAGPTRSRAYILLAALGRTTPALSLSHRDCADLAPLLTEWFARGATDERTPVSDRGSPDPGPQPGSPRPHPPDDQAPARARTGDPTPTPPRTGVREVRGPRPPGSPAGRHLRPLPGRGRASPPRRARGVVHSPHPRG